MKGERWLLRAGRFLVARAARRLPAAARHERRREWEAELPVILGDLEIKSAAARAARMLWFAADTLRGSVLRPGPGPARHRGAHPGPATWGRDARELGGCVGLLTGAAVLLTGFAYLVYQTVAGVTLPFFVCFFLTSLAGFASCLVRRRPPGQCWYSAGVAMTATGQFADALAARLGWGPPLLSRSSATAATRSSPPVSVWSRSRRSGTPPAGSGGPAIKARELVLAARYWARQRQMPPNATQLDSTLHQYRTS